MNSTWKTTSDLELLAQLAIAAATEANWQEAAKINQKILSESKDNIGALNRLARAQICQSHFMEAKKTYAKVLILDPYNIIAKKNLERIEKADNKQAGNNRQENGNGATQSHFVPNLTSIFLFEPGKTKIISLLNLAPPSVLATLNCGEEVHVNPKNHSVSITTASGMYLGALPDDLAHRLITFIAGGNKYQAFVKSATGKSLTIFIREDYKSPKFASQPSFPASPQTAKEQEFLYY